MDELEFYKAADGVRWRYRAAGNHELLAEGGEGYAKLSAAMTAAYRVVNIADVERHAVLATATASIGANRADGTAILVTFEGV